MAKNYPKLSEILRKFLFEKNMKPIDLAREVNLPQPTVHRLVTGKSSRPYKSSLKPIADYFSITVEQLVGEEPLTNIWHPEAALTTTQASLPAAPSLRELPVVSWTQLDNLPQAKAEHQESILTSHCVSAEGFAVAMPDSSMEPFFSKGTILVIDPGRALQDRCFVIVKLHENGVFVFRQLLMDAEDHYLKPLNPDLSAFRMRLLDQKDQILGCLVESRNVYFPGNP